MATKMQLNGGYALVTGAAAVIGKKTAFAFAEAGVKGVAFADLNEQGAQDSFVIKVDIADEAAVQEMVDHVVKDFGRIDYCQGSSSQGKDLYRKGISGTYPP